MISTATAYRLTFATTHSLFAQHFRRCLKTKLSTRMIILQQLTHPHLITSLNKARLKLRYDYNKVTPESLKPSGVILLY